MSTQPLELEIVERLTRIETQLDLKLDALEQQLDEHTAQDAERFAELKDGQKRIEEMPKRAAKWVIGAIASGTGIVEALRAFAGS